MRVVLDGYTKVQYTCSGERFWLNCSLLHNFTNKIWKSRYRKFAVDGRWQYLGDSGKAGGLVKYPFLKPSDMYMFMQWWLQMVGIGEKMMLGVANVARRIMRRIQGGYTFEFSKMLRWLSTAVHGWGGWLVMRWLRILGFSGLDIRWIIIREKLNNLKLRKFSCACLIQAMATVLQCGNVAVHVVAVYIPSVQCTQVDPMMLVEVLYSYR